MAKPPESVHDRLNRELYRYYMGDWKLWSCLIAVLLVLGWAMFPQPQAVNHMRGTVTGATTLQGETGPRIRIGVQIGNLRVEAGTAARFVAPANGETVCLRHTKRLWTGLETFTLSTMRHCADLPANTP